jgi:uncharacterized membrane protein
MDWFKYYIGAPLLGPDTLRPVLNQPFITGVCCVAALLLYRWLYNRTEQPELTPDLNQKELQFVLRFLTLALGYTVGLLELVYQTTVLEGPGENHLNVLLSFAYTTLWVAFLHAYAGMRKLEVLAKILAAVVALLCFLHVTLVYALAENLRDASILYHTKPLWQFLSQYLAVAAMVVAVLMAIRVVKRNPGMVNGAIWVAGAYWVVVLAQQIDHLVILLAYHGPLEAKYALLSISQRVLYPIAWGLSAFAIIYAGIRYKLRMMRIFGLALFGMIILKLFLLDLTHMAATGRIAAFISLGLLLLVISFMYQKLKALVVGDGDKAVSAEPGSTKEATLPADPDIDLQTT